VRTSTQWKSSQNPEFDYGLITLRDSIGTTKTSALRNRPLGFWGSKEFGAGTRIIPLDPSELQNKPVNISGYPADKCGTQPSVGGATDPQLAACPINTWASNQWRSYGKVLGASPSTTPLRIRYDMDTFGGHSGSPVWLRRQDFRNLIAIHRAGSGIGVFNEGVRITQSLWADVRSWMATGPGPSMRRPTLRRGSQGTAVVELQTRLNAWLVTASTIGLELLVIDGVFGSRTDAVVRTFQRNKALVADGIVGPKTWGALFSL